MLNIPESSLLSPLSSSTSSEYLGQGRVSRSLGQGQGHKQKGQTNVTKYICGCSDFDWKAILLLLSLHYYLTIFSALLFTLFFTSPRSHTGK